MKVLLSTLCLLLALGATAADKEKNQNKENFSDLHFIVVKEINGKPVRNASVVIHEVTKEGKQGKGGLQLKTDSDGKAEVNSLPYGKLRIQVLAPGFQTFGEDYEISKPKHEFTIKLKKPREQFSIYK